MPTHRRATPQSAPTAAVAPRPQTVDVSSLELIRPRSVGVENPLWAMEQLGLEALLERLGFNDATRAGHGHHHRAHGGTGLGARQRSAGLCERSALGELLGVDFERMSDAPLPGLRCAGAARGDEAHLFEVADLFALPQTVTLYDLTNTFFEGEAAAQPKAGRGHWRCAAIARSHPGTGARRRGLRCAGPKCSRARSTKTRPWRPCSTPCTLRRIALVVMDAGMAKANVVWLARTATAIWSSRERPAASTRTWRLPSRPGRARRSMCTRWSRGGACAALLLLQGAADGTGHCRALRELLRGSAQAPRRPQAPAQQAARHVWQRIAGSRRRAAVSGRTTSSMSSPMTAAACPRVQDRRPLAGTMITHAGV